MGRQTSAAASCPGAVPGVTSSSSIHRVGSKSTARQPGQQPLWELHSCYQTLEIVLSKLPEALIKSIALDMPTGLKDCPAGGIPSVHQITTRPSVVKKSGNLW